MKWAVREANRRYVEQILQEDEPGDVFQVDWYSNWLHQQQWKACPIQVVCCLFIIIIIIIIKYNSLITKRVKQQK